MDVPTIPARSIVIKNKSTAWFGTRYTMNLQGLQPRLYLLRQPQRVLRRAGF